MNIEPENDGFEDDLPLPGGPYSQVFMLNLSGGVRSCSSKKNGHPITIQSPIRLRFLPQTSRGGGMIMATHIARELGILLFTLQDLVRRSRSRGRGKGGKGGKGRAKPKAQSRTNLEKYEMTPQTKKNI